jgi:hypothetical protein
MTAELRLGLDAIPGLKSETWGTLVAEVVRVSERLTGVAW